VCKTARDSNQPNDECSKFFYRRRKKKKTLDVIPVNEDFIVFYVFGEEKNFTRGGSKQNLPQRDILFFIIIIIICDAPVKQIHFFCKSYKFSKSLQRGETKKFFKNG
jgi:hypothetical protein